MGSNPRVQTFSFSLLVFALVFLDNAYVAEGFRASLKLYFNTTAEGDYLNFETNQPTLSDYSALLPKVKLACGLGRWKAYTSANYIGHQVYLGSTGGNQAVCESFVATNTKSIRHYGASETTSNALSLYDMETFQGNEIFVDGSAYAGITTPVSSLSGTGNSQWKIFEGQYLDGKSVCITVPHTRQNYFWANYLSEVGLNAIGSVFKGCNIVEIEEYKKNQNM